MRTHNESLLDILGQPGVRFFIPAYQRMYSWQERECRELWYDLLRSARSGERHFMGTFLYSVDGEVPADGRTSAAVSAGRGDDFLRYAVVDGQQRLTTVTLILVALSRYLRAKGLSLAKVSAEDIERQYLWVACSDSLVDPAGTSPSPNASPNVGSNPTTNADSKPASAAYSDPAPKLTLSRGDKVVLSEILSKSTRAAAENNLTANLALFESLMREEGFDPEALWRGLGLMTVIAARVEARDPAQHIFESLNAKGLPLTTADLVRNYLLLAVSSEERERLYDKYWETIEGVFQPDPGSIRLENAIQGWLSVRFRQVRAKAPGEVYSVFKRYMEDEFRGTTEGLLRELRNFCMVWAENYRYHAVKKYRSAGAWAEHGAATLTAGYEKKPAANPAYANRLRRELESTDTAL